MKVTESPLTYSASTAADNAVIEHALAILDSRLGRANEVLRHPQAVKDFLCLKLGGEEREVFGVLYLDAHLCALAFDTPFAGTVTQSSVYPREIVKRALELNATAVVLSHNHPSGVPEPSPADENLTQVMKRILALVDVRVLDHIVVGGRQTVSFAERGLL